MPPNADNGQKGRAGVGEFMNCGTRYSSLHRGKLDGGGAESDSSAVLDHDQRGWKSEGRGLEALRRERELQHAHEAAKEVYVIWTASPDPSVFVTQTATKVFNNPEKAIEFFKRKGYIAK